MNDIICMMVEGGYEWRHCRLFLLDLRLYVLATSNEHHLHAQRRVGGLTVTPRLWIISKCNEWTGDQGRPMRRPCRTLGSYDGQGICLPGNFTISFNGYALDPDVATLCFDTVALLEVNATLECIGVNSDGISPDVYFTALESLQPNTTLKRLRLSPILASMGKEEMNQVLSFVKMNYSLAISFIGNVYIVFSYTKIVGPVLVL
jgi:hypothetical protein